MAYATGAVARPGPFGPADPNGRSGDLPVDLFGRIEPFVARVVLREFHGLLVSEAEHAEPDQAVVEQRVDVVLQVLVEIDEDVAAEDHGELRERAVRDEVVLRE